MKESELITVHAVLPLPNAQDISFFGSWCEEMKGFLMKGFKTIFLIFVLMTSSPAFGTALKTGDPNKVAIYKATYQQTISEMNTDEFFRCLAAVRMLRADTIFSNVEYYEDILMVYLQATSAEQKKRSLSDEALAGPVQQYFQSVKSEIPDDMQRMALLSGYLVQKCNGQPIIR